MGDLHVSNADLYYYSLEMPEKNHTIQNVSSR